jgi:MFS family permease
MTVMIMFLMVSITPKMVNRFGIRKNMVVGMVLFSIAMFSFSLTPSSQSDQNTIFMIYALPASLVAALGMSLAYIPVLTSTVSNIQPRQAGLGSGLVNTSYQIGSALGLAITVAWAASQSERLVDFGISQTAALNDGFHLAFTGAAIISIAATVLILLAIKNKVQKKNLEINLKS